MATRKIIPLGKSSLVITLPQEWLKKNNLIKGDIVEVSIQQNQSLLIKPEYEKEHKEEKISIIIEEGEPNNSIVRIITGCYLNGYDIITLNSRKIFSSRQQQAIRQTVKSLYLRIIESTSRKVIIQILMDESRASVLSGIERMHIITNAMCNDVLNSMKESDIDLARSVVNLEDDVDQFLFFLLRLIRSSLIDPSLASQLEIKLIDCLDWQTLIYKIENVADYTNMIAQAIIQLIESNIDIPQKIWNALTKSAEISFNSYNQSVDFFLTKTVDHSNRLIDSEKKVRSITEEITPFPSRIGDRETFHHLFAIRENIRRISESVAEIAELTIDRALIPQK
jgi:phosphate uptake regulator